MPTPTAPPSLTATPVSPDRANRATFSALSIALDDWRKNFNVPEMVLALANVYNNALSAFNDAASAAASAGAATAQALLATTNGAAQVDLATAQANAAASSALTAVNAPGTSATSTTSATIGMGSKSLTIQAGKSLVPGMTIVAADTAAPDTNAMTGIITSYNSGTGALVFTVSIPPIGSGTKTAWTVSLSPPVGQTPKLNPTSYYLATL